MGRRQIGLLLLVGLPGSCVPHRPPVTVSSGGDIYRVPLAAVNTDLVCAESILLSDRLCMTVGRFRELVLSVNAQP